MENSAHEQDVGKTSDGVSVATCMFSYLSITAMTGGLNLHTFLPFLLLLHVCERVHSLSGEYGAASVVCAHMAELACVVASSSSSSSSPNQGASDVRAWLRKHAE